MDLFEASCQGIGLALAAGMFAGAIAGVFDPGDARAGGRLPLPSAILLVIGGIGGGILFGASLASEDHPAWPGWFVGAAFAVFAFMLVRGVVIGAGVRAGAESAGTGIAGMAAITAFALAGLALLWGPLSLLALAGLVFLALGRRRRAGEKHAGLRSLR